MNIVPMACISPTMCCVCTGKPQPVILSNDRQRWAKTGEDPGKCKQNKHQIRKTKRTNVSKNSNINSNLNLVLSLPDFPGYYTEHEIWTGIIIVNPTGV